MLKFKKTFYLTNYYKQKLKSHNKQNLLGENIGMKKNPNETEEKSTAKIYVMPPQITDADITALFNGIVNVVKKKCELETKAEIININASYEKLLKELKEKQAECNRLKNEILYLKSKLEQT